MEAERAHLTERLAVLAKQLNTFDSQLSDTAGHDLLVAARVGTCPYSGYPSLGSAPVRVLPPAIGALNGIEHRLDVYAGPMRSES